MSTKQLKTKKRRQPQNFLASETLGEKDVEAIMGALDLFDPIKEMIANLGGPKAQALSDNSQSRCREQAAKEIQVISAIRNEWVDFVERGDIKKIPLADLYAMVLTADERLRNLDFILKTLIRMLKDGRVPDAHKSKGDQPGAIRLTLAAVCQAKEKEFERNLELVEKKMGIFFAARDKGQPDIMEHVINQLTAPYFKGALAEHNNCAMADLKHLFIRLQQDVDAVKSAKGKKK